MLNISDLEEVATCFRNYSEEHNNFINFLSSHGIEEIESEVLNSRAYIIFYKSIDSIGNEYLKFKNSNYAPIRRCILEPKELKDMIIEIFDVNKRKFLKEKFEKKLVKLK